MGWVPVGVMEVEVACYKAGLPEVLWGGRENSYSCPRVCSTCRGIVNIRNCEGECITGLDL